MTASAVVTTLYAVAFLVAAVTVIVALFQVAEVLSSGEKARPSAVLLVVVIGIAGVAAALLLAAVAAILNYLQLQVQIQRQLIRTAEDCASLLSNLRVPTAPVEASSAGAGAAQAELVDTHRLELLLEVLQDINDNLLMTPEQRVAKRERMLSQMRRQLAQRISQLAGEGKYADAQSALDEYERLFPDEQEQIEQFGKLISEARARSEESDYEQAAAKIRDLTSVAAWDQAEEVASELLKKHPRSQRAAELLEGLRLERSKFEQQQRRHIMAQIDEWATKRRWREAYAAASELIEKYPDSSEAEILRGKIDTLRDNAEIEIRKDLEQQLKDLVRRQRFIEALALAQDIVRN